MHTLLKENMKGTLCLIW